MNALILINLFLLIVFILFLIKSIKIVPQQQAWVIERLGKFYTVLSPGLNLILPLFDRVATRYSLREALLPINNLILITQDSVEIRINLSIYYKIIDPNLVYNTIENYEVALTDLVKSNLFDQARQLKIAEIIKNKQDINISVKKETAAIIRNWGISVERLEFSYINSSDIILK